LGRQRSFIHTLLRGFLIYALSIFLIWTVYYVSWGRYLYLVTAYCNCPICINVKKYQDNQFASGKRIYWGGIAADPKIPFRSHIELLPTWPQDWMSVAKILRGRRKFIVEDRGGKIKGRHIDLFIPDSMGGHKTARNWGVRRMRIKINGVLAE